ncbi:MAG: N-acetylglucosamine-6-phosphate deacetylase [Lachnospiraceae bacterium]|nr:N-acetylglucosamine-6-phosphate deacetylase [Lachnospiraceae bacterium]
MLICNGDIFVDGAFQKLDMRVEDGRITGIGRLVPAAGEEVVDAAGDLVIPGLVEIHSHACIGHDFANAEEADIHSMCEWYAKNGVTTVLATTMTNEYGVYKRGVKAIKAAADAQRLSADAGQLSEARIAGINMEGPFLGLDKKGAHDPQYLMPLSEDVLEELDELSGGRIRLVDLDPTLDGAIPFIEKYSKTKTISLAHTSCTYELAKEAVKAGANHVTHLFNAMDGLHHRKPGLIGAVMDENMYAEIICDGVHVHPAVIRLMFAAVPEKMVLISDSMSAAGLSDGEYELGGLKVYVKDGKATLADGTIAGSTIALWDGMQRAVQFGVKLEDAVKAATENPAKSVRIESEAGYLIPGREADFCIADRELNRKAVYLGGKLVG